MKCIQTFLPMLVVSLAAAAFAQDLSGTYSGTIKADAPEGQGEQNGVIVIKQDGGKLVVTAGPTMEEQYPANKVETRGDSLMFEVGPIGEPLKILKFDVTAKEGRLSGQVIVTSGEERLRAKVEFARK